MDHTVKIDELSGHLHYDGQVYISLDEHRKLLLESRQQPLSPTIEELRLSTIRRIAEAQTYEEEVQVLVEHENLVRSQDAEKMTKNAPRLILRRNGTYSGTYTNVGDYDIKDGVEYALIEILKEEKR